ncbi:MAG: hypothetical protein LBM75_07205 [Myxococcales bacterium]|jgi:hypothetical protein|nr:hypothetical protein [Myxococcales bacterium]
MAINITFKDPDFQRNFEAAKNESGLDYLLQFEIVNRATDAGETLVFAFGEFQGTSRISTFLGSAVNEVHFYGVTNEKFRLIKKANVREDTAAFIEFSEIGIDAEEVTVFVFADYNQDCKYSVTEKASQTATELVAAMREFQAENSGASKMLDYIPGGETVRAFSQSVDTSIDKYKEGTGALSALAKALGSFSRMATIAIIAGGALFIYYKGKQISKVIMEE